MNIQNLVALLDAHKNGAGWMARCPAHDDRNPSLAIVERDGKILVHCHAGCHQAEVITALKARGLWRSAQKPEAPERRTVVEYNYTDERGELLYQVVRYEPKTFKLRYPDGKGGWIWQKHAGQVLYRLREVLEARIVFVVEGEKDVETLRQHGFVGTTNAGGCKAPWLNTFTESLCGRDVVIIPDNDKPGWERCRLIARSLLGKVTRLACFDDHAIAGFKDISDWFAAGHAECEFINRLQGVDVLRDSQ